MSILRVQFEFENFEDFLSAVDNDTQSFDTSEDGIVEAIAIRDLRFLLETHLLFKLKDLEKDECE